MTKTRYCVIFALPMLFVACGGSEDPGASVTGPAQTAAAPVETGERNIAGLPDPCAWLSAEEAQELLAVSETLQPTSMGNPDSQGRSCVYTNQAQTRWINVSYQGLNPQVFSAQGKSEAELIELASTHYAHTLDHVETIETGGYPTLAFSSPERTIMVVFTDVGKRRDMGEGLEDIVYVSSYYNILLHLTAPEQAPEARLQALKGLVDRPVKQLLQAVKS